MKALQEYRRTTERALNQLGTRFQDLERETTERLRPNGWSATVSDLAFYDKGLSIPDWQDIGCAVSFEASDQITVVSIGCSMVRDYAYSTLHYEITGSAGNVVVPRSMVRLANASYGVVSASQTNVGRLFAHMLHPGVYEARLWVGTQHANSMDWDATLRVHSASLAVRNF